MRLASLAGAALLCGACSNDAAIRLVIDGDLAAGVDFDEVDLALVRDGAEVWSARRPVAGAEALPLAYRIDSTSTDDEAADILVEASLDGRTVVWARRAAAFVHGRESTVRVCLWQRCRGGGSADCEQGLCDPSPGDGDAGGDADADDASDSAPGVLCDNTCALALDGRCQDGGEGAAVRYCDYGTDCGDCGRRAPDACVPGCDGRRCGSDGCGGACPPGCAPGEGCFLGGACVRWIRVAATTFTMGAPEDEIGRTPGSVPQRTVELTRDFLLTELEVSQAWFAAISGYNPTRFDACDECPAESVSWNEAAVFCNVLSLYEGLEPCFECSDEGTEARCGLHPAVPSPYECRGYRLPTEAEWELAARAGTATATYNGDLVEGRTECETPNETLDPIAWFCGNAPDGIVKPRGLLEPNALGFHDILGNASEYAFDYYGILSSEPVTDPWGPPDGSVRAIRGGAVQYPAWASRAAARITSRPDVAPIAAGFRVARTAP